MTTSKTVVLVHGAWHGGWCWERVVPLLAARGLEVHTPTLTGLGDRVHLVSPLVSLSTHVDDIVSFLRYANLREVVLVGHSYAGLVVREAADRVPELVGTVALVDAWVGDDGASVEALAPPAFTDALRESTDRGGFGWLCPPPTPELVGVTDPDDARWLEQRLVPQPFRTFLDHTHLSAKIADVPHHAALCTDGLGLPFKEMAASVGCSTPTLLATGHNAMVTVPAAVADFVAAAAS